MNKQNYLSLIITLKSQSESNGNHLKKTLLLLILFVCVYICNLNTTYSVAKNFLDNDASGELVLSHELFQSEAIILPNWYYSTELRITNQIIWSQLFSIFSDWSVVRFVGTVIIQLLYAFSITFLLYSAGCDCNTILLALILMFLPFCVAYGRIVLYHV